ncbi:MAG: hypothetical protein JO199_01645 [Candidatus Eremiobacteraeota bacterium]|nr:hypothetical protein [Candidatus Eremiobacteraeota bacterium]
MKRVKLLAFAAALAATAAVASAGDPGEPADGLVFDTMTAPATVSYVGHMEVVRSGEQSAQVYEFRVEHRAPDLTLRVYSAPNKLNGDEVVIRGKTTYAIDNHNHRVTVSENDATQDDTVRGENYLLMRANYRAVKESDTSLDGRDAYVVGLVNKFSGKTTMLVDVDKTTKLTLYKVKYGSDGTMRTEVRFEDVKVVPTVADADFAIPSGFQRVNGPQFGDPNESVTRVVSEAGFSAVSPKSLPLGFSPVGGKLVAIKNTKTVHLIYSDGIRTVSLFENAGDTVDLERFHPESTSVGGHAAQWAQDGQTTLLTWTQDNGIHCALVGDVDLTELQKIAASI